jgi:hypothetical protein
MTVLGELSGHASLPPGRGAWEHAAAFIINGTRATLSQGAIRVARIPLALVA